jgi:hypothetical protein
MRCLERWMPLGEQEPLVNLVGGRLLELFYLIFLISLLLRCD